MNLSTEAPTVQLLGVRFDDVPADLRERRQWVAWRVVTRDDGKPTKVPYHPSGRRASSTDPATWSTLDEVREAYEHGGFRGIGYVFAADDPFCGIDIDSCRDPATGVIDGWAQEIIDWFYGSYCEVSPSGTGVKLFVRGELPGGRGGNVKLPEHGERDGKGAGVEFYNQGRYFAITGHRLADADREPCEGQEGLDKLLAMVEARRTRPKSAATTSPQPATTDDRAKLVERARTYASRMPPAVSGHGGHDAAFAAACVPFRFGLTDGEARQLLDEYNARCVPPWSEYEIAHKLSGARERVTIAGEFGSMLRDERRPAYNDSGNPFGVTDDHTVAATATPATPRLEIRTAHEMSSTFPAMRPAVIRGLLRRGEIGNLIAASKMGKSWLTYDLAWAVVQGCPWFGFETVAGDVLIVDNELHPETLAARLPIVAQARKIRPEDHDERLHVANLRGALVDLRELRRMMSDIEPGRYRLIILDALYRMVPSGWSENDNAQMASLYNELDALAKRLDCAIICVHHASKGVQGDRSITDTGAGAGAISRAADLHLILREHEEPGCVVLDAVCRSWARIEPRCLRWTFPTWEPADELDPAKLKRTVRNQGGRPRKPPEQTIPAPPKMTFRQFATTYAGGDPMSKKSIVAAAVDGSIGHKQAEKFFDLAVGAGVLIESGKAGRSTLYTLAGGNVSKFEIQPPMLGEGTE